MTKVGLGGTGWSVWSDALLRTTGFPAGGLEVFAAPEAAGAADELLAGRGAVEVFDEALARAVAAGAERIWRIAADPLFREAVTWQNPGVLVALDGIVAGGPRAVRNVRRRDRERAVVRYWQRYCAKNETIGFFGPVCWVGVGSGVGPGAGVEVGAGAGADADADAGPGAGPGAGVGPGSGRALEVRVGPGLLRERRVFLEGWALAAYADHLAADGRVRCWWPPMLLPQLSVRGRSLLRPLQPPLPLSAVEAQVLARCDGRTPAVEVVAGLDRPQDGYLLLERLVERELITWDAALPVGREAEEVLRTRIAAIGDLDVRREAAAGLARLCAAREAVAAAAGDAAALKGALAGLDAEFTALTGGVPRRRDGQMYAGRTLCYEDTARDLDVTVGTALLDELAAPLAVTLTAARWLTAELADAYATALRELHDDLREDTGDGPVSLADLMSLAQGLFWGEGRRPADDVAEAFTRRWESLFGLEQDSARVQLSAADLAEAVARLFPARRPGWSTARLHSPDLQICATDVEAINRGDYQVVLGELHAAWPTFDCDLFTVWHPEVPRLRDELSADVGEHRVRLLYPAAWPRQTGRVAASLTGVTDRLLGFAAAPGADPDRLLPATAVTVSDEDGELVATAPDGHRWPLIEMFAGMLNGLAVDAFKLTTPAPHAPRITIDRLVIARETWRTTVAETGLAAVTDERERYLATRAWRARLGLPDRVFIKIGTEVKPCYSDLTSPHYVGVLCTMLRTAGDGASVTITEALPTPDQAWVPDHAGNRYFSELRLQITDPDTPGGAR